jgi:hypothetical protein
VNARAAPLIRQYVLEVPTLVQLLGIGGRITVHQLSFLVSTSGLALECYNQITTLRVHALKAIKEFFALTANQAIQDQENSNAPSALLNGGYT